LPLVQRVGEKGGGGQNDSGVLMGNPGFRRECEKNDKQKGLIMPQGDNAVGKKWVAHVEIVSRGGEKKVRERNDYPSKDNTTDKGEKH